MENKNFINQSLWAGSSPNQTGETLSRENRIGVFSYFYRTFVLLFMLLTIGVGQMWGWGGMVQGCLEYTTPSGNINPGCTTSSTTSTSEIGTVDYLNITGIWITNWTNNNNNDGTTISGTQLVWRLYDATNRSEGNKQFITATSTGTYNGNDRQDSWTGTITPTTNSGEYYFKYYFETWFGGKNPGNQYLPGYESYSQLHYKIAPPAVSGFGVTTSGYLAGSGTSEDPYLVKSGESLTFTVSGSKARTDDNSTFNYWLNPNAKQTSGTLSTGSITSSDLQSAVIHGQCINNSSSSLFGTESTSTIYYKAVDVKDITVCIYVGGCTDDQINSLVLTGTPYVGSKALSGVHINTPAGWTTDGNWRSYTFSNVTKVHNLQVAGMGGAIPLKNIENATEDFYYRMFDGTELDDKCVSAPNLTWTTAPVDAKVGVHMKAVVNTTPVSDGSPRVTWYTSNSNIAAVNESTGEISYKAAGDVTITAHVTWDVSGDYCAGYDDLEQTITVIAPEITAATFVQNPILTTDHLQVSISYRHIPAEGCYIRLKKKDAGYYDDEEHEPYTAISEGSGNLIFTTLKTDVPSGVWTVEIWNQAKDKLLHSRDVEGSLTVKTGHTITVTAGANGAVSPSTVYAGDGISSANFTATPNTGYEFIGWTKTEGAENFTLNSPSSETTHVTTASSNGTVRADFRGKSYTLTLQNTGHGRIISSPEGTARTGETVTITPTPDSGYEFDYIEVNGVSQGSGVTTFTMPGADVTVTAHFKLHSPELGAVIATPSGTQNYAGSPIDFALSVTSTYLPNPVVVFLVNDGTTIYEVVGAPYGAEGNSAAGTIGDDAVYTTVHKATFTASAAKTYTVSAKLYEGLLLANWDGKDFTGGGGWEGSNGHDLVANPNKQAVNGSNYVRQFKKGGNYWEVDLYRFAGANQGIATFRYAHTRQYRTEVGKTWLKLNDGKGYLQKNDELADNTWQKVVYDNGAGRSVDFFFPLLKEGNTSVYFDDIILSNEETMTEKATAAAPASFSINWNYTVTLNNNDATTPGTESVNVTYGSALSNIAVPSKTDYTFYGYYTENAGEGRQLIDAAGVWIASVDGYTDENKNWVHGDDVTLYAKWGKNPSLTGLELSTSVVTTGNTFTARPTIDAGDGRTTNVCWAVKNSSDEEVSTTITPIGGNAVTITAPDAPGKYKVVATLREGKGCEGTVLNSLQQPFTVEGRYSVTITNGTGSSFVGEETTATVTADPAAEGKKFDHWEVTGTITKYTSGDENSRVITFNASSEITLTAVYTDRDSKTVYFAKPSGWSKVYAYAWENSNTNNKNGDWTATDITSNTVTIKGTPYHYYQYYVDDNGEDGGDKTNQGAWDRIIFHNGDNSAVAQSTKTADLTLVNGHFYHVADGDGENGRDIATVSGSASAEDWYVCGYWDQSTHDWGFAHPVDLNGAKSGSVVVTVTASRTQEFKIYRASTNEWFKWTGGPNKDYYDNYAALIGDLMTLRIYNLNRNTFTSYATGYRFTLDITNTSNPVLTLTPNDNTPYSATLSKNGNGSLSVGTGAITLHQYIPTTITATPEPGYRFKQWTVSGVSCSSTTSATATFTASAAGGTIEAEFTNEGIIYLDKSAISSKWSGTPYVYFYSGEYWNNVSGSGSQTSPSEGVPGTCISASNAMTRIGESQIWYYDYSALLSAGTSKQYIAFVDKSNQTGKNWFDACSVIYRGDFYPGASMFVVRDYTVYKNQHDNVQTAYYNEGYWRKYNDTDPGYVLKIYNGTGGGSTKIGYAKFASEEPGNNTCTAKINLSSGLKGFKVEGCDTTTINGVSYAGTWYSNSGSMTSTNCSNWEFTTGVSANCGITPTAGGDYIFTLSLADGRLYVSVEYPLANNDYRIVYNGKVKTTGDATHHPSNFIRNTSNGGVGKDTVSFFVTDDGEGDPDWSLTLQKCTNASANPVQWANACDAGHTLTASDLDLSGKTGVYVFEIEQNSSGSCSDVTIRNLGEYTGNYYIRTDVADGGWEAYETVPDNKMIFSEYARDHSGFDYYHCHWTPTNTNVKFTIANDYSACITDTVENDTYVTEYGKLPYQASVRFMYNSATNSIGRAYLNGSSEEGVNTFLWLEGAAANGSEPKIFTESGSALTNNIIKMQDKNNWIYQIDIQANEQARVKLISNYRFNSTDHLQYFKGTDGDWSKETTSEIIGGNYSSHPKETHDLRIIYDFKTNHLLSAWLVPGSGSVPEAAINTNVMIIKQNQEDARQITFSSGNALTEVDTVYTAVLLTKDFLTGSVASEYAKQFYWVSFPYTVQINDIFGSVGTYGYDWILQRYNGKKRAANGFWIDSEPNWEFMDKSETLNPYEGYILTLDLSEFTSGSLKWNNNVTYLSLYFPSDSEVGNIKQKDVTVEYDQTGYACTITRDNRNIKDSYWHCIGSPSFAENTIGGWNRHENTDDTWKTKNLPFLYEWNSATNQLSPVAAGGNYTFKPLTGYMVQYSGASLNWTNVVTPSVSAPKRQNSAATDLTYKLQLVRGEEEVDHTFVRFSDDENITAAFEFNQDLCKEYKSGANIYTLTSDQIQVAGNSLPLSTTQTTVVPVGVKIKTAGDYTFSIPEGTDGIGVTLVDNETGVRTLLSALDYTVNLTAGTHDGRFVLEISPIQNTPTDIENVQGDNVQCTKVRKVMIDGILYIVKDGKIFDARGARVE